MVMNKKGFVKIIEAVIAIIIIFIFMFSIIPQERKDNEIPENIRLFQKKILGEIQSSEILREEVLKYPIIQSNGQQFSIQQVIDYRTGITITIDEFIRNSLDPTLDFNYTVCTGSPNLICIPDLLHPDSAYLEIKLPSNKAVYAKSLIIANSTQTNTFRLYLWENF